MGTLKTNQPILACDSMEVSEPATVCLILAEGSIKSLLEHTW